MSRRWAAARAAVAGLVCLGALAPSVRADVREECGTVEVLRARLCYRLWRAGAERERRPLVVYLHGGPGANGAVFRAAVGARVARRVGDLLLLDQRGCGRSPAEGLQTRDFTLARYAEDAATVIDAVRSRHPELGEVVLVGHSFGAAVAVVLARMRPALARRLVLVSPALDFRDLKYHGYLAMKRRAEREGDREHLALIREMEDRFPPGSDGEAALFAAALAGGRFGLDARRFAGDEEADLYRILAAREGEPMRVEDHWKRFVEADRLDRRDLTPELPLLAMPVLIVGGEEDCLTPPACLEKVRALARGARLVMVPRAGHHPYLLDPESFVEILKDAAR